jgi:LmbE family N-acetylglucosaminyl deacetylase
MTTAVRVRSPDRILVVSPDRDDDAIGCGGTIVRHVAEGCDVMVADVCVRGWSV